MKKAAAVVMTVMLCIGMLAGCGGGGEDKSASKSTGSDAAVSYTRLDVYKIQLPNSPRVHPDSLAGRVC